MSASNPATNQGRRAWLATACLLATGWGAWRTVSASPTARPLVEVWKDPNCGCCKDWIDHMVRNGFEVKAYDKGNNAARAALGMPQSLGSCHTARVQGYVLEGHVPASDVRRLLTEKPKALGLAVPGMPVGSPGMDGPEYGDRRDPYQVLLVLHGGATQTFSRYN